MATRAQWRRWYSQYGDWLPYDQVRGGVLGAIMGCLVLLVPAPTAATVALGCALLALSIALIWRGVAGLRKTRLARRRERAARWRPHG